MLTLDYSGCRVTCKDCAFFNDGNCSELPNDVKVNGSNNVCNMFANRIINPSMPPFDFDDYFYWLVNDYYRPYTIDKNKIIGSAMIGEIIGDNGRMAELLPGIYQPLYQTVDLPRCSLNFPKCHIEINGNKFEIRYLNYRNQRFLDGNNIKFLTRLWKDKPNAKKYNSEHNGIYAMQKTGD